MNNLIKECLNNIKGEMRLRMSGKKNGKSFYEYRINKDKINNIEKYLIELYAKTLEQAIYMGVRK